MIDSFKLFDIVYVMTGGGPMRATEAFNFHIYQTAFRYLDVGYASAMSVTLLLMIVVLSMAFIRAGGIYASYHPGGAGARTRKEQHEAACVRGIVYKMFVSGKEAVRAVVHVARMQVWPGPQSAFGHWRRGAVRDPVWETEILAAVSLFLSLLVSVPAAYGLARFGFRFRRSLGTWILISRMAPLVAMLIPFYLMYRAVGMLDTYTALIFAHVGMNLPLITWMLIGFFKEVPREIEEGAYLDGCSSFGAFVRVTLPVAKNGIIAVAIIGFIFSWNELMFATTLTGTTTRTAPAAISNFLLYQEVKWGALTAAAVVVTIPVVAFIGFAQRHLMRGLTFGMQG